MDNAGRHIRDVIAENLDRLMVKRGMKQPQLEQKSGVPQATISRITKGSGDQSTIAVERVEAVARGLGCEAWELLIDEERVRQLLIERFLK